MPNKSLIVGGLVALTVLAFQNCAPAVFTETLSQKYCGDAGKAEVRPDLLWDWKAELAASPGPHFETFDQVMASPMVADLDGDTLPEVVFTTFSITASDKFPDAVAATYRANGVLRVVNGQNGRTIASIGSVELAPFASQSPLLMDIDGDGRVEIFYVHYLMKHVVALNSDASLRWKLALPAQISMSAGGLTGARLDTIGASEVQAGPYIISEDASKKPFVQATLQGAGATHYTSLAMPLDPARPNQWTIVTHEGLFDAQGKRIGHAFPNTALWVAAGDIDPDSPGLEVVATGSGWLHILNGQTGNAIRSVDLMQYNELHCNGRVGGGPPSIGDFDGDPTSLEIAVATGRHLTIFDSQGVPKYKTVTQDCSSLSTGLTSFDLNHDGKPEILYADEEYLRIFEVRNGKLEILHTIVNPSGTLYEYPVIADLSGTEMRSHMILAANNYTVGSFYRDPGEENDAAEALNITGVRAFRSSGDRSWAPTRAIWNQHSYHPDLVDRSARFLAEPSVNPKLYRRNVQAPGFIDMLCDLNSGQ